MDALQRLVHEGEPVKPLDVSFNNEEIKTLDPKSDFVIELQDSMQRKFAENTSSLIESHHKYRTFMMTLKQTQIH